MSKRWRLGLVGALAGLLYMTSGGPAGASGIGLATPYAGTPQALRATTAADQTDPEACAALQDHAVTDSSITSVTYTPAGPGVPEPFCEIRLLQTPHPSSIILSVVRLPSKAHWNGQFLGYGNGGFAGGGYGAPGLRTVNGKVYAVATTNMGTGNTESDMIMNIPRIADWGYRSTHEMTVAAKELIKLYYGTAPAKSFFSGFSTGGQQGLIEAQRYPYDYDAILSGGAVTNRVRLHANFTWSFAAFNLDPAAKIDDAQLTALHNAVIARCDGIDGVKDGVIRDARDCGFQPSALLCPPGQATDSCLTAKQVAAVEKVYNGMVNPRTGKVLAHGWPRGSELGWKSMFLGSGPAYSSIHRWVFGSSWKWQDFDYDTDVTYEDAALGGLINATNPDLSVFKARGGKLLMDHGWADPTVNPFDTVGYYTQVEKVVPGARNSARLFMIPAQGHAQVLDFRALENWVATGTPPDQLTASVGGVTRLLCAYPKVAQYKGHGSTGDPADYSCVSPHFAGR